MPLGKKELQEGKGQLGEGRKRWVAERKPHEQNVIYTHMEYYTPLKRNEILTHATTWMKLEDLMLSEISQIQKTTIV